MFETSSGKHDQMNRSVAIGIDHSSFCGPLPSVFEDFNVVAPFLAAGGSRQPCAAAAWTGIALCFRKAS
jgi:hypothetical protein